MSAQIDLEVEFPNLAARSSWGPMTNAFRLGLFPPDELISNVSIVPFCDDKLVVLRLENGRHEPPGGTREPNEAWIDTLRRELVEEAGAELKSFSYVGSWQWTTAAAQPYRPHLPHPTGYRVVGVGEISITGEPTNPANGEQVAAVEVL